MSCGIAVLTKEPRPGAVKTRLIPSIGAHAAARLHETMAWETIARAISSGLPTRVSLAGDLDSKFADRIRAMGIPVEAQVDGDLGDRLLHVMRGSERTIALGTDCVVFDPKWLRTAAANNAVSIGPADDGGYWLIGMTPQPSGVHEKLFRNIPWSTASVCQDTVRRLHENNQAIHWLPQSYDVDTPEDLARLRHDAACPGAVMNVINEILPRQH